MLSINSVASTYKALPQRSQTVLVSNLLNAASQVRANLEVRQSVLSNDILDLSIKSNALNQSKSSIIDIDVAQETANLTLSQIKQQAAVTILSQANSQPQIALSLLSGR